MQLLFDAFIMDYFAYEPGINLSASPQTSEADPLNTILGPGPSGNVARIGGNALSNRNYCLANPSVADTYFFSEDRSLRKMNFDYKRKCSL